jgi:hypothetical protein
VPNSIHSCGVKTRFATREIEDLQAERKFWPWGSLTRSRRKSAESDGMRITTGWSLNDPTAANAVHC